MVKYACDEEDDQFLAAQVPIDLLDRDTLEGLIRGLSVLADISPHRFVDALVVGRAAERASAVVRTYREMSSESRSERPSAERIVDIANKIGASASQTSNTTFALEGGSLQANIMAECLGHYVSLRVLYESLHPAPEDGAFFHEMAVANHRLRVAKLTLNQDDRLSVSYEVPFLSPKALADGLEIINASVGSLRPLTALLQE
jgi:hypothetical protein